MRNIIENSFFEEERSLFGVKSSRIVRCRFGEDDLEGESPLKEAEDIEVEDCLFRLRYPLWHVKDFSVRGSRFEETSRAPLWYTENGVISDCVIDGVKAVRESRGIKIVSCEAVSPEFGWKCRDITIENSSIAAEYLLFDSCGVTLKNVKMKGKYSFQYIDGLEITDSDLDTKDAFWHSRNVTVKNCRVKGEYLGWYSEGLTLIDCDISGTQPFCWCKGLKLIRCTMTGCDLSFEHSDVEADIIGGIDSVKAPLSGKITADSIGEMMAPSSECIIKVR